ncbi:MAG: VWA domain-containing protein [Ruminococcus flavefaciens]|nr:MAG: von Willebrand factor type A domain protein [Firmicutes bacterium ADurb.BinA205]HOC33543.1 VWA domain-containing protein [Ruminococcus flavefaciens]HQL99273.1 VWA domain-containing protein [Ruminococcus flavefaciens]
MSNEKITDAAMNGALDGFEAVSAAKENTQLDNSLDFDDDPLSATGVSRKSLVIFFLIDTSGSMKGKKMGELNTVMEELIPEIRRVGEADTEVKVAVLTFSTDVRWMYSTPIPIEDFEWARLRANGVTSMGAAFKELSLRMSRNSFLNSPSLSFAPVIFLMTDGYPSDDYREGLKELQSNSWYKFGLKAALGIGNEANDDVLAEFTGSKDTVVHAYSGGQLAQMIKIIAVTSSQIGSKSMTLSDDTGREIGEEDVFAAKQKLLGQQIQELVGSQVEESDVPFDTGW